MFLAQTDVVSCVGVWSASPGSGPAGQRLNCSESLCSDVDTRLLPQRLSRSDRNEKGFLAWIVGQFDTWVDAASVYPEVRPAAGLKVIPRLMFTQLLFPNLGTYDGS